MLSLKEYVDTGLAKLVNIFNMKERKVSVFSNAFY